MKKTEIVESLLILSICGGFIAKIVFNAFSPMQSTLICVFLAMIIAGVCMLCNPSPVEVKSMEDGIIIYWFDEEEDANSN